MNYVNFIKISNWFIFFSLNNLVNNLGQVTNSFSPLKLLVNYYLGTSITSYRLNLIIHQCYNVKNIIINNNVNKEVCLIVERNNDNENRF